MNDLRSNQRPKLFQVDATLPDPAVANPKDAWSCGSGPSAPVVLFDGVQVVYEPGWTGVDGAAKFKAMVEERGGKVEMIDGLPAFVNDGDPEQGTVATVSVITPDGVMLNLDAVDNRPAENIVPLATSIVAERLKHLESSADRS